MPETQAIPTVWIVTAEETGRYLFTEEVADGYTVKVGPHFYSRPDMVDDLHTEEIEGHDLLTGILSGFPPTESDAFCLNGRPIPLNTSGAQWVGRQDPEEEWEIRFRSNSEDGMSHVLEVVSSELRVATIFMEKMSKESLLFKGFSSGSVIDETLNPGQGDDAGTSVVDDPTIWILVHEDFNYPLFYRPDPTLTIGPYLFTHEKAAIEAAYDFPSDIVVARPGRVSRLFDEMTKDHEFTDGFVIDPSMDKGFTLYEGIVPLTEIGASFADHLMEEEFWGLLDPFTLRRFAFDVMKKRTGMEPMD